LLISPERIVVIENEKNRQGFPREIPQPIALSSKYRQRRRRRGAGGRAIAEVSYLAAIHPHPGRSRGSGANGNFDQAVGLAR